MRSGLFFSDLANLLNADVIDCFNGSSSSKVSSLVPSRSRGDHKSRPLHGHCHKNCVLKNVNITRYSKTIKGRWGPPCANHTVPDFSKSSIHGVKKKSFWTRRFLQHSCLMKVLPVQQEDLFNFHEFWRAKEGINASHTTLLRLEKSCNVGLYLYRKIHWLKASSGGQIEL